MEDLVSIIMPSYNSSRFIGESISSVLKQSYTNWELLIVDDCSRDDSIEVVNRYVEKDCRVKLISLTCNVGAAKARNVALETAKGRFIAFLDSDDIWRDDKLEYQVSYMLERNIPFSFSSYDIMKEDGVKLNKIVKVPFKLSYSHYLRNTIIGCLTVVIDRNVVGDFRMPIIRSSHDMALWLLIMKRGFEAYGIEECLATYRIVATSNTSKKWKAAKDVWKVYRNIEHLSIFYSMYCFCGYAFNAIYKRVI
ncbi:glycosyltransferase family 2 protein [Butyricimonas synergistica]|uniref:glycosyltransferase family 2 protein n=1 Tax=Butyricimonas synergistica TaxID=544644 RepID=UPI0022E357A3|nr:glycosyltransferase [Butyricimonas synergistica]